MKAGYFDLQGNERKKTSDMECESNIFAQAFANVLHVFISIYDDDENPHFYGRVQYYKRGVPLGKQAASAWNEKRGKFKKTSWARSNSPWTEVGMQANCTATKTATKYDYDLVTEKHGDFQELQQQLREKNNPSRFREFSN